MSRLKEAFDSIQAEEKLKMQTREYIVQKTRGHAKHRYRTRRWVMAVMACVIFLVFGGGGYFVYFTPVYAISVDVNPSLELGINRFDRVVSVEGYNEDGKSLASVLKLRYLDYRDALEKMLENEKMAQYMEEDQFVSITVLGNSKEKSDEMLENVSSCTIESHENVHCFSGDSKEAEAAHGSGMSLGKYNAYLELKKLEPSVTEEEVKELSMCQIRDWIERLSGDGEIPNSSDSTEHSSGEEHHHSETHAEKGHNNE